MISSSRVDESIESLIDSFEVCKALLMIDGYTDDNFQAYVIVSTQGEDDKKSWASFQERISRTPEQVLR